MKKTTKSKFFTEKKKNKMKAWVPVTEVKTMESEKEKQLENEEEKRRSLEEQQQEEEKKKILSSLPPNYVTLAQLRENWMKKQQNEINQQKQQVDSAINRHAIGVDSEDGRKSVAGDEIGGGNEDLKGNVEESKELKKSKTMKKKKYRSEWKKRKAMKAKVEEKGAIEEGGAAEEKTLMQIESKDVKNSNSNAKKVDEVEREFRVLSVNSGNRKVKKMNDGGFRESQSKRNNRNGDFKDQRSSKAEMIWVRKGN